MKELVNIFGKIILITCIILIVGYMASFIVGLFECYNNGAKETFLFGGGILGPHDTVYGKEAIKLYLANFFFELGLISVIGILPGICIPIFVAILLRFKKLFSKKAPKRIIVIFIICILLHIMAFNDAIKYYILLLFLPYIESIIISYLITRAILKLKTRDIC